jgi:hypothetical protein
VIARTFVVSCRSARRVHRPPFGRMTRHAAILACLAMLPVSPAARAGGRAPAAPCAAAPSENDAIEAVSPQGEIKLASGRFAKLEGIRLAEGEHHEQALAWLNAHVGRHVSVAARRRDSDRWGRVPASVVLADRPVRLDLAQGLVDLGLAVADAGEADAFCAPELLALESAAREQGLGVWAADGYKPASSADAARLRALAGRFALVEGRIRSIGERQQRTYLNFGSNWANDFTIIIPKRTWATLRDRGLSARFLNGRRVRGRGLIEAWRGPTMEILASDMLEVLDQDRLRR